MKVHCELVSEQEKDKKITIDSVDSYRDVRITLDKASIIVDGQELAHACENCMNDY